MVTRAKAVYMVFSRNIVLFIKKEKEHFEGWWWIVGEMESFDISFFPQFSHIEVLLWKNEQLLCHSLMFLFSWAQMTDHLWPHHYSKSVNKFHICFHACMHAHITHGNVSLVLFHLIVGVKVNYPVSFFYREATETPTRSPPWVRATTRPFPKEHNMLWVWWIKIKVDRSLAFPLWGQLQRFLCTKVCHSCQSDLVKREAIWDRRNEDQSPGLG